MFSGLLTFDDSQIDRNCDSTWMVASQPLLVLMSLQSVNGYGWTLRQTVGSRIGTVNPGLRTRHTTFVRNQS